MAVERIVLRILTTQKERAQHGSILKLRKKKGGHFTSPCWDTFGD